MALPLRKGACSGYSEWSRAEKAAGVPRSPGPSSCQRCRFAEAATITMLFSQQRVAASPHPPTPRSK